MTRYRVAVAEMPPLLSDIVVRTLSAQEDIRVTAVVENRERLIEAIEAAELDVAVVGCEEGEIPEIGRQLLLRQSRTRIVAITGNGRDLHLYELCPRMVALGQAGTEGLVEVIRGRQDEESPPG